MNIWLLSIVTGLYLWTSYDFAKKGEIGMAITFFSYAIANTGLIVASLEVDKLKGVG